MNNNGQDDKVARDRDLLFGVIATRLGYVNPGELATAAGEWAANPGVGLDQYLVERGVISAETRDAIDSIREARIKDYKGDPSASLASFGGEAVHESFAGAVVVTDRGVESSLSSFGGGIAKEGSVPEGPSPEGPIPERPTAKVEVETQATVTVEHPNRYTIKAEHGRGGIGRVLLAFDEHIGREVALKELIPQAGGMSGSARAPTGAASETVNRFLREARITGQLEHPGIVPVYELGKRADGSIYYTMKLVRGVTLLDQIRKAPAISDRLLLLNHFLDLCQAMAYAHSKGVIHRDLKPLNVMVGEFGETVVLDWGLAKVRGLHDARAGDIEEGLRIIKDSSAGKTMDGALMGTPAYMSPEQAEGKIEEVDERSDIWSLGAILYEILCGRPPYTGETAWEVMGKVLKDPVPPLEEIEPSAPPELIAICNKCLQKDRDKRYADAGELAKDVAKFQAGGLVSAYEYSMAALIKRWLTRRWPVVVTSLVAAVILVSLGTWSYFRIMTERNRAVEQRIIAENKEREARRNLAEAYYQYGMRSEINSVWNFARVFYAKAVSLYQHEGARSGLFRESLRTFQPTVEYAIDAHPGGVYSVAVSPDGKLAATGGCELFDPKCRSGIIKLWAMDTGEMTKDLQGHKDVVDALAFTPDGQRLVSGGWDGTVRVWDLESGQQEQTINAHQGWVTSVAVSPGGSYFASGGEDGIVKIWSIKDGSETASLEGHEPGPVAVAFSPDGGRLLSAGVDKIMILWSTDTWQDEYVFGGHEDWVRAVAVSPAGDLILSGSRDLTARLWSVETGEDIETFSGQKGEVTHAAFFPDGKTAMTASANGTVQILDLATREPTAIFTAHPGRVMAAAVSPDGVRLLSGGEEGELKIWKLSSESKLKTLAGHSDQISGLAVTPDGKRALSGSFDRNLIVWDLASGDTIRQLTGHESFVRDVDISPDGNLAASGGWDGTIRVWDIESGVQLWSFEAHEGNVTAVAFAPNGVHLASGGDDDKIGIWDLQEGKLLRTLTGHSNNISSLAFDPGGGKLYSGSWDGKIKVWDPSTGQNLATLTGHDPGVSSLATSPDGTRLMSGGFGGKVIIWDTAVNEPVLSLVGHRGPISSVAFSGDGRYALTTCSQSLKIWELESGECIITYPREGDMGIATMALTPDGKTALLGTRDAAINILPLDWNLFEADGKALLDRALEETGLALEGFDIRSAVAGARETD